LALRKKLLGKKKLQQQRAFSEAAAAPHML
jgi:hypothetical protein